MVRIIPENDVYSLLSIDESISALETLNREFAAGRAATTFMETIESTPPNPPDEATDPALHQLTTMSGVAEAFGVGAVRINSDISHWPERHGKTVKERLPGPDGRYSGLIALFSTNTTELLAMFPFSLVSAHRVAASSVLGAMYMANEQPEKLGLLGAGWQARWHLQAYAAAFDLDSVDVYSPTPESRRGFAEEMNDVVSPTVTAVDTADAAVEDADVIQCATNSSGPVFDLDWLEPGVHVSIISHQEAPDGFFTSERLTAFGTNFPGVAQYQLHGTEFTEREFFQNTWNTYVTETAKPVPRLEYYQKVSESAEWGRDAVRLCDLVAADESGRMNTDDVTGFFVAGLPADLAAVGRTLYDAAEAVDAGTELGSELLNQQDR